MHPIGYSPYQQRKIRPSRFKAPKYSFRFKKWLLIFFGVLFFLFFIFYLALGPLRFFANHYLGLGFFSKDYVIILQNNAELRPTGGFLTAYGTLQMRFGLPRGLQFSNSYEIDTEEYVTPPVPHETMLAGQWYQGYTFRDANWNPDFPSASQELINFYQGKFPEKEVDGMIAINFTVMEDLIDAFGGIKLQDQLVTSENLFSVVTQNVNNIDRHNEAALEGRKDILAELFQVIQGQMKRHPFKTRQVMVNALNTKEMFLWLKNERLQEKIVKRNWGNTLVIPEGSDFLHVNIANLGGGKGDRYVQKYSYSTIDLSGPVPKGAIEVVVRYPGNMNQYVEDYQAYVRIYLHPLAEVETGFLESSVTEEGGFKVIGQEISVSPGKKATLTFNYTLPQDLLTEEGYQLYLSKQSGDLKWYDVVIEGVAGSTLMSDEMEVRENKAFFTSFLEQDRVLKVQMGPDDLAPYPTAQNFIDLNKIEIYWNEAIDEETATDILNYSLTDMNHTNEEMTDEIKVIYAEMFGDRRVEIEIEGATEQELERYALTLKNIRDLQGNTVEPDPKVVTVVQRLSDELIPDKDKPKKE